MGVVLYPTLFVYFLCLTVHFLKFRTRSVGTWLYGASSNGAPASPLGSSRVRHERAGIQIRVKSTQGRRKRCARQYHQEDVRACKEVCIEFL